MRDLAKGFRDLAQERRAPKVAECAHRACETCRGTGRVSEGRRSGHECLHFISCQCPACNPYSMSVERTDFLQAVGEPAPKASDWTMITTAKPGDGWLFVKMNGWD